MIILFFCLQLTHAQNLVQDSSFEVNKFTPIELSCLGSNFSWSSPSRATTDLFCKCNDKKIKVSSADVPKNSMGNQDAHSGKCYAGLFAVSHGYYREYMQTELMGKLRKGKNYIFSMFVSLSDYSPLAIDQIGFCFLNGPAKYEHSDAITNLKPIYICIESEIGTEVTQWHQLTYTYTAKGGESVLLIGAFEINKLINTGNYPPIDVKTPINKRVQRDAYYYIDDVSLFEEKIIIDTDTIPHPFPTTKDTAEIVVVESAITNNMQADTVLAFKNVLFQSGEAILTAASFNELNALASYLDNERKLRIEIYGHTDNAGDEKINLELSINRAKAVCDYLIAKGIDPSRVTHKGFGSSKPISLNNTEEGRKRNRRVEFVLIK